MILTNIWKRNWTSFTTDGWVCKALGLVLAPVLKDVQQASCTAAGQTTQKRWNSAGVLRLVDSACKPCVLTHDVYDVRARCRLAVDAGVKILMSFNLSNRAGCTGSS